MRLESVLGEAAARDWLRPLVPVAVHDKRTSSRSGRMELTLWVPNNTFAAFLSGRTKVGQTLRSEAARQGIGNVAFATNP